MGTIIDVLITKVRYNNVAESETRINKVFEMLNRIGESQSCFVARPYLLLKLKELYLAHEYQEKLQEEKEEQRRIREELRDEELARREIEKALKDADREESRYAASLRRALEQANESSGRERELLGQVWEV